MASTSPSSSSSSVPLVHPNHKNLPEHVKQAIYESELKARQDQKQIAESAQMYLDMSDSEFFAAMQDLMELVLLDRTGTRKHAFAFLIAKSPPLMKRLHEIGQLLTESIRLSTNQKNKKETETETKTPSQ